MTQTISDQDIHGLVAALSEGQRETVGGQVAHLLQKSQLPAKDLKLALSMVDKMLAASTARVRANLAAHIAESPHLPRPMIDRLLADIETVALPVVQLSTLLNDDDLIGQMARGTAFQEATARREQVSARVADHIVEHGTETAVGIVIRNPGASMDDRSLDRALDRFHDSIEVMGAAAERPRLPIGIAERLVSMTVAEECIRSVSDLMLQILVRRHDLPAVLAEDLVMHGRDRAVAEMARSETEWGELDHLADRMHGLGRLSSSLMLRVLASGDTQFFAAGMSKLSGWPKERVKSALMAAGADSFRRLFDASGLEPMLFHAFRVARDEVQAASGSVDDIGNQHFVDRVVDRIADEYRSISPAGLEQVLSRLRQKSDDLRDTRTV